MELFKVDDWVLLKGTEGKIKVHILEVRIQKCCANIEQAHYLCRPFPVDWNKQWGAAEHLIWYNEIELEPMPIEEKGKT